MDECQDDCERECQTWALEGDECPGLSVRDG